MASGSSVQLLSLIVTQDKSKFVFKAAKKMDLSVTTLMGSGTVESSFLNMLGITSPRREVLKILLKSSDAKKIMKAVDSKLQLGKPGHGIAYFTNVLACAGVRGIESIAPENNIIAEENMYHKITAIVDRGNSEKVTDIAKNAGARGGTVLHGRGSAGKDAQTIFGVEIEPEKDLVIIITPSSITENVFNAIAKELDLESPGKGVIFVEPIVQTHGLFESQE